MKKFLIFTLISLLFISGCGQQEKKPILNENSLLSNIEVPCEISKKNIVEIKTEWHTPDPEPIITHIDDKEQIERFIDELYTVEVEKIEYIGYGGTMTKVSVKTKDGEWFYLVRFGAQIITFEHQDFLYEITNLNDLSDEFTRVYLGGD